MHILLIDDKKPLYDVLKENFAFTGHLLFYAENTKNAYIVLKNEKIDVILLDVRLGNENGVDTLNYLKEHYPEIPVIMITGYASVESAVQSMKLGAYDYVKKPLDFDILCQLVENAAETARVKKENRQLRERLIEEIPSLTSKNPVFNETLKRAQRLAKTDISILITGENGTGKELLADYIHKHSNRVSHKMLKINCAAFPESLLDNELFGHEKGAYTGANTLFKGIFERADKSTLFLDEIGDMPLTLQVKLLRVIQNQEIRRIGGKEIIKIDARFIAATNKNLEDMMIEGTFREDLFYRLNAASLKLPPLRERLEDMEELIKTFLMDFSEKHNGQNKQLASETFHILKQNFWPGNIRELKNVLNYAATISQEQLILPEDLPPSFSNDLGDSSKNSLSPIQLREREFIEKTLKKFNNNKSETAKYLDMSRNTLYLKMKRYNISL